ncbi:hypothetical protein [Pseudomonas sp. A214]|uniref:hypothetical protein n=1 Tax=Pseudomonas sp. A214 TaxID=1855331 RepID=UPI0009539735|nr:hypothetical protein [Pseudomonas sp. A214]SIR84767.1 hypothetical protein SAMN05216504_2618 [Pseudomonas sp. A214]
MSASLDYFSRGIAKAFERRAKAQQQATQVVETVHSDSDALISVDTSDTKSTYITKNYQAAVVQKIIALIHKRGN